MGQKTAGDLLFERYLEEHGYCATEHEPDLGVGKRPDFVIAREDKQCVVEVKEFAKSTRSFPDQRIGSTDAATWYKPVRSQLHEAGRKLKVLADSGLPLVAMLSNPLGAVIDLSVNAVVYSMYGDPGYTFSVDAATGAGKDDGQFVAGRNGRYRGDHQFIGAVALLGYRQHRADFVHELFAERPAETPEEGFRRVDEAERLGTIPGGGYTLITVIVTANDVAVPVPDVFFNGPRDRWFELDDSAGAYVQTRGPILT